MGLDEGYGKMDMGEYGGLCWTRLKRAWDATASTEFGVSSLGREGNSNDPWQDVTNEISFREMTLVTVWMVEWEGRLRKQGDRAGGHRKIGVV